MTRSAVILLLMLVANAAVAQLRVTGIVVDSTSGRQLEGYLVEILGTTCSDITDNQGKFDINCNAHFETYEIAASGFNYRRKTVMVQPTPNSPEVDITILLEFESVMLPDISIDGKPSVVWKDEVLNVADIAFSGNNMLLLAYKSEERWKRQEESKTTLYRDCQLVLLDEHEKEIGRKTVPEVAVGFYSKYPGEIFLIGRYKKFYVDIDDSGIELLSVSEEDFNQGVKPIVALKEQDLCVSNYEEDFPEFGYSLLQKERTEYIPVRTIVHEHQMEMFRSEYKYMAPRDKLEAFRFEINTGIDKEIVAGYMTGYANSIYYEPINAPLIDDGNQLYIFDHVHGMLYQHNWDGSPTDSVRIAYHLTKKPERWSGQLLHDHKSKKFFTTSLRNGRTFIAEIDKTSGQLGERIQLYYNYIEKVSVHNEKVYYIYRPFESSQNRYLYSEWIVK
jgi:hypothetical protein